MKCYLEKYFPQIPIYPCPSRFCFGEILYSIECTLQCCLTAEIKCVILMPTMRWCASKEKLVSKECNHFLCLGVCNVLCNAMRMCFYTCTISPLFYRMRFFFDIFAMNQEFMFDCKSKWSVHLIGDVSLKLIEVLNTYDAYTTYIIRMAENRQHNEDELHNNDQHPFCIHVYKF